VKLPLRRREGTAAFRLTPFRLAACYGAFAWMILLVALPHLLLAVASLAAQGDPDYLDFSRLSLSAYGRLLSPEFLSVFASSTALAGGTTLICLLMGYPFAWVLARAPQKWRGFLLLLTIIPFWTNSLIRTYALIALLNAKGLINAALLGLGLIDQPLELLYTDFAVFLGLTYTLLPFMVLPLYGSIEKLDPRLAEAARDLGAGRLETFLRVSLPLTMPGIAAGCMFVFLPAMGMFYIPDVLGGARTLLLGSFIKAQFLTARDWPFGAAASVVLMLLMAVLYVFFLRAGGLGGPGGARRRAA